MQTQIENKKQLVETAFQRLQQELEEQQRLLLDRLRQLKQHIWRERDEYLSTLSEEVTRLGAQVRELEDKCQQPASELLQVRDTPWDPHPTSMGCNTLERGWKGKPRWLLRGGTGAHPDSRMQGDHGHLDWWSC